MDIDKLVSLTLRDPILLTAVIVFIITVVILVWAFRIKQDTGIETENDQQEEDLIPRRTPEPENSSLLEAHLKEMTSQLSEISQRVSQIEKNTNCGKPQGNTASSKIDLTEIAKLVERLEVKLDVITSNLSANQNVDISSLESKLEGIHKLLVFLTDSGNSSNQK